MSVKIGMTRKILLADDHSPTRIMFRQVLDVQHYQAIHARNEEEAYSLAVFERLRFGAKPRRDGWFPT
jgi:hypothetical protein